MSYVASGRIFQDHMMVPVFMVKIVASEPLKRVTGRILN
jgi:hypothetical protein